MKKNQTIKLFGQKIPMWQDCKRCGAKLAVRFVGVTYNQPCNKCRNSKEWQEEQEAHKKERSYEDIFATHKPTAVFEYKGDRKSVV